MFFFAVLEDFLPFLVPDLDLALDLDLDGKILSKFFLAIYLLYIKIQKHKVFCMLLLYI